MPIDQLNLAKLTVLCPIPTSFFNLILPSGPTVKNLIAFKQLPPVTDKHVTVSFGGCTTLLTEKNVQILQMMHVPPVRQLNELLENAIHAYNNSNHALQYLRPTSSPITGNPALVSLPLWIILWWCYIGDIIDGQKSWSHAIQFLEKQKDQLALHTMSQVLTIHWNAKIPSSLGGGNSNGVVTITSLAHDCSEK
ncbi:hypothetical protein ARMGADRAFT_1022975 [Armillaria gallica]|uniref:Uncharacterized protein n=1 Tax=Armillaria gallica TaxID=47427 RepID=A0A2H3EQ77_ARMGA|nr:hypothetical protein ARMGADRAFT_1022975 [Armillaria gallica]